MLDKKMLQKLNEQINHELHSAYLYLSMAAYFESMNFKGFAHWMKKQAQEEQVHAMKFFDYIYDRGDKVELTQIAAPEKKWKSPLAAFEAAYKHEQKVTGLIHALVKLANEQKDYATASFLQWYVDEQVEEEASADEIVQQLKLVGDNGPALLMLDKHLGARE